MTTPPEPILYQLWDANWTIGPQFSGIPMNDTGSDVRTTAIAATDPAASWVMAHTDPPAHITIDVDGERWTGDLTVASPMTTDGREAVWCTWMVSHAAVIDYG